MSVAPLSGADHQGARVTGAALPAAFAPRGTGRTFWADRHVDGAVRTIADAIEITALNARDQRRVHVRIAGASALDWASIAGAQREGASEGERSRKRPEPKGPGQCREESPAMGSGTARTERASRKVAGLSRPSPGAGDRAKRYGLIPAGNSAELMGGTHHAASVTTGSGRGTSAGHVALASQLSDSHCIARSYRVTWMSAPFSMAPSFFESPKSRQLKAVVFSPVASR